MEDIRDQASLLLARLGAGGRPTFRWRFAYLGVPATARILELGRGPGTFWKQNLDRLPPDWEIVSS